MVFMRDEQITLFCFEVPPIFRGKINPFWTGALYHLDDDIIYVFLQNKIFCHTPEKLIKTLIHEDIERAIHRVFWDTYIKACGWSHLVIKIAEGMDLINEVVDD